MFTKICLFWGISVHAFILCIASKGKVILLEGKYSWERLENTDNLISSKSFEQELEIKSYVEASYRKLTSEVQNSLLEDGFPFPNATISGVTVEGLIKKEVQSVYEKLLEMKSDQQMETIRKQSFKANTQLFILKFIGPGITFQTSVVSPTPHTLESSKIHFQMDKNYYLEDLTVLYTVKDTDCCYGKKNIKEVRGRDANVNLGFGGRFVWFIPKWTEDESKAVTGFKLIMQKDADPRYKDLAKGARGLYRYIVPQWNSSNKEKIVKVALYRIYESELKDEGSLHPTKNGWQYATGDLNERRGKDKLYLVWNSTIV